MNPAPAACWLKSTAMNFPISSAEANLVVGSRSAVALCRLGSVGVGHGKGGLDGWAEVRTDLPMGVRSSHDLTHPRACSSGGLAIISVETYPFNEKNGPTGSRRTKFERFCVGGQRTYG